MKPERKIVAAAVATVLVWLLQVLTNVEVAPGIEGAFAVIVGYFVPSDNSGPWTDPKLTADA